MSDRHALHLGQRIATALGEPLGEPRESLYLHQVMKKQGQQKRSWNGNEIQFAVISLAAAMLISAIGGIWIWSQRTVAIPYRIGDATELSYGDNWVRNEKQAPLPILFENGSRFDISAGAAARVLVANKDAVRMDLSHGVLVAQVRGNGHTRWQVSAGPYTVTVLGTRFRVAWDATTSQIEVAVYKGTVGVEGAPLTDGRVRVSAGQQITSDGDQIHLIGPAASKGNTGIIADAPESDSLASPPKHSNNPIDATVGDSMLAPKASGDELPLRLSPSIKKPPRTVPSDSTAWKQALTNENWQQIFFELDMQNRQLAIDNASENQLWQMANWYRQSRHRKISDELLKLYRQRYAGSKRAATAAFLLGKTSLDQGGNPKDAIHWLSLYLGETSDGFFREEAFGRLMDALITIGDTHGSRVSAQKYLAEFPAGIYADKAKRILSR